MKRFLLLTAFVLTCCFNSKAQEYVDLGLSVNWSAYNIGAKSAEEPGTLFITGSNIEFISGQRMDLKDTPIPRHNSDYSGNPQLDTSTQICGPEWRTPTYAEWHELITKCSWRFYKYRDANGVERKGYEITGPNGNKILLPCNWWATNNAVYQCSTPDGGTDKMNIMMFTPKKRYLQAWEFGKLHAFGLSYRPVTNKQQ